MKFGHYDVVVSQFAPSPHQIRYPKKGPYWQRRNRKMRADPKNWSEPQAYIMGRYIICHPTVVALLGEVLRGAMAA